MSDKKTIKVKIDPSRDALDHKKSQTTLPSYQLGQREQAATRNEQEIQPYSRQYHEDIIHIGSNKSRSTFRMFKPFIFASLSAVVIGSILGIILMNMFVNIDDLSSPMPSNSASAVVPNDTEDESANSDSTNNEEVSNHSLQSIQAFILQGGVFSELSNAETVGKEYEQKGFPAIVWERDNQYILIVGITDTMENAKSMLPSYNNAGLEPFPKEWTTNRIDLELTNKEYEWVISIQELLQQTLISLHNQETSGIGDRWQELLENVPNDHNSLEGFIENIEPYQQKIISGDHYEVQLGLLSIWKSLEEL